MRDGERERQRECVCVNTNVTLVTLKHIKVHRIDLCWFPAPGDDITRSVMEEIVTDPAFYYDVIGVDSLHDFTNKMINMTCALPGK